VGSKPFTLKIYDTNGSMLGSAQVEGRQTLLVSTPDVRTGKMVRLHVDGGGLATPGDSRILNFRVFGLGCAEDAASSPSMLLQLNGDPDITPDAYRQALGRGELPADGVLLGRGWYTLESPSQQRFRWVANDAELVVTSPRGTKRMVELEVEPGPGVGSQPFVLQVLDSEGQAVASIDVHGRGVVRAAVPTRAGTTSIVRLHVVGGGLPTPNDPRTLNFRVFSVR
jgi:hypothetical protein